MPRARAVATVRTILLAQLVLSLGVALVALALGGAHAAVAALVGGSINMISTGYFARRVFGLPIGSPAAQIARAFYIGEVIKILLAAALFSAALVWWNLPGLPPMLAYAVSMGAFWVALPLTAHAPGRRA